MQSQCERLQTRLFSAHHNGKEFTNMSLSLSPPISLHHQSQAFYVCKAHYLIPSAVLTLLFSLIIVITVQKEACIYSAG